MAKVHRTATGFAVIPVDPLIFDPTSEGDTAEVGGLASYNGVLYYKFGGNDTQWSAVGSTAAHVSAPLTGDGSSGSPFAISPATESIPGSLSAADKTLVDSIGAVSTWAPGGITFGQPVTVPSPTAFNGGFAGQGFYSGVLDFTAPGTYTIIPPCPYRLMVPAGLFIEVRTKTTATVGPTLQAGTDVAISNLASSQTPAGIISQAAETQVAFLVASPRPYLDLTTNGLRVQITGGGTAAALTGRVIAPSLILLPV